MAVMLMSLIVYGGQAYTVQRKVTLAATTAPISWRRATTTRRPPSPPPSSARSSISEPDPLPLQRQRRRGRTVGTAGDRQRQWNRDRHGLRSWANANGAPRPVGQQLSVASSIASAFSGSSNSANSAPATPTSDPRRGSVPVPADRHLFHRRLDHALRFDHDDPPNRRRDHGAVRSGRRRLEYVVG